MAKRLTNILFSHPTGNTNVRALLSAYDKAGLMAGFITTIAIDKNAVWLKYLPLRVKEELLRRTFPVKREKLITRPARELARLMLPKIGLVNQIQKPDSWANINAVYRDLDTYTSLYLKKYGYSKKVTAIYAYEDGALASFTQAKKMGIECIYELPIAYWKTLRKLLSAEAERMPAWAITLKGGIADSSEKTDQKTRELDLADKIIVPSSFVSESLPESASHKQVRIAAFGSPIINTDSLKKKVRQQPLSADPLRILFVGSMSQRKGLGDLFEAMKLLKKLPVELVVLGSLQAPMAFYRQQYQDFRYETGRTHSGVLELMRECDIFCLPSIVEGRALVLQEAMSQALPLIITPNTGGADLIINSETGFLVDICSPSAIAEKITWFYDNWQQINSMGSKAQKHAADYTWQKYADSVLELIEK